MLWKKDNTPSLQGTKSGRQRSLSISTRLILLFTLSGIGVIALTFGLIHRTVMNRMDAEDNLYLIEGASHIQQALKEGGIEFLKKKLMEAERFHFTLQFRGLDEKGRILFQTSGMKDAVPPEVFPSAYKVITRHTEGVEWKSGTGRRYRLLAIEREVFAPSPGKQIIQIAFDVTDDDIIVAEYKTKLGVVFIIGTIFFVIVGFFITRIGLYPLREMENDVKKISANHLSERVALGMWPKELIQLAHSFDNMLDCLENSFTRLSEFSANIAHELRNPLNNLMGEIEVSLSRSRTADEYRHVLESSLENLAKLSRLTNNLLFLARAEDPATHIQCSRFDALPEIKKICDFFEVVASKKGVELSYGGSGALIADRAMFNRAVSNLIDNALHFTPPGGKIEIFAVHPDEKSLAITVRDTGPGINTEDIPHLLDRFFRSDAARSSHTEGTGLGLAIVKSIMDLHGGFVNLENRPGGGAEARLLFVYSSFDNEKCINEKNNLA